MSGYGEKTFEGRVEQAWLDHNGHMNVGYYVVVFDKGTDGLFEFLGVGERAMEEHGETIFVLEAHVTYHKELILNQAFYIETRLLGHDHNKLQYIHWMYDKATGDLVATNECLCLNVDVNNRRTKRFREESLQRLVAFAERRKDMPLPPDAAGRAVRQLGFPEAKTKAG